MLVWQVDARLDQKMVIPVAPSALGFNMPVVSVDCSEK
jgi:hypothetical protein